MLRNGGHVCKSVTLLCTLPRQVSLRWHEDTGIKIRRKSKHIVTVTVQYCQPQEPFVQKCSSAADRLKIHMRMPDWGGYSAVE